MAGWILKEASLERAAECILSAAFFRDRGRPTNNQERDGVASLTEELKQRNVLRLSTKEWLGLLGTVVTAVAATIITISTSMTSLRIEMAQLDDKWQTRILHSEERIRGQIGVLSDSFHTIDHGIVRRTEIKTMIDQENAPWQSRLKVLESKVKALEEKKD